MKKGFLLTVWLLFGCISMVFGQLQRGALLLEGSVFGDFSINTSGLSVGGSNFDQRGFGVSFSALRFSNERFAFGGSVNYSFNRFIQLSSSFGNSFLDQHKLGIGLIWDQYKIIGSEGFFIFSRIQYAPAYNQVNSTGSTASSRSFISNEISFRPGIGFLVNDRFGLKLNFGGAFIAHNTENSFSIGNTQSGRLRFYLDASLRSTGITGFFLFNNKNDAE